MKSSKTNTHIRSALSICWTLDMAISSKSCTADTDTFPGLSPVLSSHHLCFSCLSDFTQNSCRMDDMLHAAWSRMPEYFKSHPLESPSSPTHNPYSWTYGMEGQDWIKVIGRTPENMRKFAIGISVGILSGPKPPFLAPINNEPSLNRVNGPLSPR